MIGKVWSREQRFTIKSCASVVLIGATVALAILIIRVVGEQRLQRFLDLIPIFKRRQEVENLINEAFMTDSRS